MTTTANLAITHIAAGQNNKEITANEAFERIEDAITEEASISVAAGNVVLTQEAVRLAPSLVVTGASVAGRTVTLPTVKRALVLSASAANTQSVAFVRGTTSLAFAPGETAVAYMDGTANGLRIIGARSTATVGGLLAANNLADLANANTALTNLGGTTTGKALFVATDAAAARTAIGFDEAAQDAVAAILFPGPGISVVYDDTGNSLTVSVVAIGQPEALGFALSDEATALTVGTDKVPVRMPYAFNLSAVRLSLGAVSTSGAVEVDVKEAGVSIFSTRPTIDAGEDTSTTAATPAVISDTALADDARIAFDIVQAGTNAKGLKIWLIGTRA